jgi:hypothetical protein
MLTDRIWCDESRSGKKSALSRSVKNDEEPHKGQRLGSLAASALASAGAGRPSSKNKARESCGKRICSGGRATANCGGMS